MKAFKFITCLIFSVLCVPAARSDLVGPDHARFTLSPDGNLLVRIKTTKPEGNEKSPSEHDVIYYQFDAAKDAYIVHSSFHLTAFLSQMLYVSDSGDLVLISLDEEDSIRLYSRKGKLEKSWSLADFLEEKEINGCAKTGATIQWLEEGVCHNRRFFFKGPSSVVRALPLPYTIMRGADKNISFSGSIDLETLEIKKRVPDAP